MTLDKSSDSRGNPRRGTAGRVALGRL